jgi:hypothetical protein
MSRGRKERTPAQLAVLAQAREKAKIVIAERAKLNALAKTEDSEPESVSKEAPQEPVPVSEDPASESEDEEPRLTRREVGEISQRSSPKYHYINGMYIKIK